MEIACKNSLLKLLLVLFGVAVLAAGITGGVLYAYYSSNDEDVSTFRTGTGAIASNGVECAEMGKKIFELGGNVADVAVTTILCEGVSSPASCGRKFFGIFDFKCLVSVGR